MSEAEVVFEQEGLRIVKYCGPLRPDGKNRTRFELRRDFDKYGMWGNASITLNYDQMVALVGAAFITDEGNKEGSLADRAHAPSEEGAPPTPERVHPKRWDWVW